MIVGKIFGCDMGNCDYFAVNEIGAHSGLIIKIGHSRINQDNRCYHPRGVHGHSFTDVNLITRIVAKLFMDINELVRVL